MKRPNRQNKLEKEEPSWKNDTNFKMYYKL